MDVLPLVTSDPAPEVEPAVTKALRNPLLTPLADAEDTRRRREADLLVAKIKEIHASWQVADDVGGEVFRRVEYRDIMILVRRRTHPAIYERALRLAQIPFVTSRYGGLLDTLEAKDMVALLEFLVSPFADLKLAHALRALPCSAARTRISRRSPAQAQARGGSACVASWPAARPRP